MTSPSTVVTPEIVRRVAELSRLRLSEAELPLWTEQLSRIVAYIDQLEPIEAAAGLAATTGPATPLREDMPRDGAGEAALEANAPRRLHGYGVVPRVVGSGS